MTKEDLPQSIEDTARAQLTSIEGARSNQKTEAETAADYKKRLTNALDGVLAVMNEAKWQHQLVLGFQLGPDSIGRTVCKEITASKWL